MKKTVSSLLPIWVVTILLVAGFQMGKASVPELTDGLSELAATCEQHNFGNAGVQISVYSDGRAWNFTAENDLTVKNIEIKSVLASPTGGTFYIQVQVNGDVKASWSQYVNTSIYLAYTHSAEVDFSLNVGDTITYFIYGGTLSTPVGGITGENYVKLCDASSGGDDYIVNSTADSGEGTLRQAMLDAKGSALLENTDGVTITFDASVFPPSVPVTIELQTELPVINWGNLTIDGSGTGVILDGSGALSGHGFNISSDNNIIRGLQIFNFPSDGIQIYGGAENLIIDNVIGGNNAFGISIMGTDAFSNTVQGNLIGTDASGSTARGNKFAGVRISDDAQHNLIGGPTAAERNIISGGDGTNRGTGVTIYGAETDYNQVIGNFVGTNLDGSEVIPNCGHGIALGEGASHNRIENNIIGGSDAVGGVVISNAGTGFNLIIGNLIGIGPGGESLPNINGIMIWRGASDNLIGGHLSGDANVICNNSGHGIIVKEWDVDDPTIRNTISSNSIYGNFYKGINLEDGGNTELPAPVLFPVTANQLDAEYGSISGTACASCRVEIFSDNASDGRWYEGVVTATVGGTWTFEKGSVFTGAYVTATATDGDGNTSEFSDPVSSGIPLDQSSLYLPIVLNAYATPEPPLTPPVLAEIDNQDGNGSYTVGWSSVNGATSYRLEEDDNASFSTPTTVYAGGNISVSIAGKGLGTYYYRVRAENSAGNSDWSDPASAAGDRLILKIEGSELILSYGGKESSISVPAYE